MANQEVVERWNRAAGNTVRADTSEMAGWAEVDLQADLLFEENKETFDAIEEVLSAIATEDRDPYNRAVVDLADGMADMLVVMYGLAARLGFNLDAVFDEVMRSNNTKINWEAGEPWAVLPSGKIGKTAEYEPPRLRGIVHGEESLDA
jgi:predicted HAD superfamily Cof-like phosphohydrolase